MNEDVIRIEDILEVLAKRWKMIGIITILATLLSTVVSCFFIAPKYEASTKLFIGKEQTTSKQQDYSSNDVQMYQKLLKTYAEVIQTNDLVERAIESEAIQEKSEDILKNLKVTPRADTQILEISYKGEDAELAKELVGHITTEFIDYSKTLISNGNVQIIEEVKVPQEPVSPNKKLNIAIAFMLGLMVSVGLSFLIEFMDNTFKTKEQIENELGVPAIGVIPDELNF